MAGGVYLLLGRPYQKPITRSSMGPGNSRSSPHLSALTLQSPNPLLPPFGSHLERLMIATCQQSTPTGMVGEVCPRDGIDSIVN